MKDIMKSILSRVLSEEIAHQENWKDEENYKRIEVECVDRPEQTISYEPDYYYYEK